ncbi:hypothetical protein DLJ53_22565 [Acuticoccus sediminis]|uniref:DUF983 domain-containing protein n=1 Tax=Acuticoccus sediminis TaxID=2184697 RepID=A0A8B2NIF9_9HYPH|nr:DUF983 domain-containing protein [Acuticoccus sediminis]RAH99324.1 hypothetical protein DLJ53_22565 [Acuticoccus sediminis]
MNDRSPMDAMMKGMMGRCPNCGVGSLFDGFLKVRDTCPHCGEALYHHRADDAPPYIVMSFVGIFVVAVMFYVEIAYEPALWIHAAIFLPLTIVLSLVLLRPTKGLMVGLQWAKRMHGFNPNGAGGDA